MSDVKAAGEVREAPVCDENIRTLMAYVPKGCMEYGAFSNLLDLRADYASLTQKLAEAEREKAFLGQTCDARQTRIIELLRENAALRNLANNLQPGPISEALTGERYTREAELTSRLREMEARVTKLTGYVRHHSTCDSFRGSLLPIALACEVATCTCGASAALSTSQSREGG